MDRYLRDLRKKYEVIQYIGLAADEQYRLDRKENQKPYMKFPLVEWGWTESDAIEYCYKHGYDWEGLYKIFHRVSCWCCPLQSFAELKKLRRHFPELWNKLRELDAQTWREFRSGYSVLDIEKRFDLEDALSKAGYSISNRAFHTDLKRLLAGETTIEDILQEREVQLRIQLD